MYYSGFKFIKELSHVSVANVLRFEVAVKPSMYTVYFPKLNIFDG